MKGTTATLWKALEEFPPFKVRLLAKRTGSGRGDMAIIDTEIAITSALTLDRVRQMSRMTDWLECTVREVHLFCTACNFDPANPADRCRYYRYRYVCNKRGKPPFQWLKKSPRYHSELLPLLQILKTLTLQQPT